MRVKWIWLWRCSFNYWVVELWDSGKLSHGSTSHKSICTQEHSPKWSKPCECLEPCPTVKCCSSLQPIPVFLCDCKPERPRQRKTLTALLAGRMGRQNSSLVHTRMVHESLFCVYRHPESHRIQALSLLQFSSRPLQPRLRSVYLLCCSPAACSSFCLLLPSREQRNPNWKGERFFTQRIIDKSMEECTSVCVAWCWRCWQSSSCAAGKLPWISAVVGWLPSTKELSSSHLE